MLHRVREIIEKLRKDYEEREKNGSMTSSNIASGSLNALDDVTRELDKIYAEPKLLKPCVPLR